MGKQEIKFSISPKKILFFQSFDVRRLDRDFFPGSQFDDRAVRAPPATRVLVAGSRGESAHVVNEK